MNNTKYYIGLDVGGTKIEAALLADGATATPTTLQVGDQAFSILERQRIPTQRDKGYHFVLQNIAALISGICQTHSLSVNDIAAIGIGLPGSVSPSTSIMINGNSQVFIGKDIIADLKKALDFKQHIYIDNDANLFALAETFWGAGLQHQQQTGIKPQAQISVGIILGTGCGGGVIIKGEQLIGRNGGGAEIGHSVLISNGLDCYCGRHGCAEQYVSGSGLELMYQRMSHGKHKKGTDIFAEATTDTHCQQVLDAYLEHLGLFLTNLTNIFDPDYIVLGGGVSQQTSIYPRLNQQNHKQSFIPNNPVKIVQHVLGDSAGVLGAALLPILRT